MFRAKMKILQIVLRFFSEAGMEFRASSRFVESFEHKYCIGRFLLQKSELGCCFIKYMSKIWREIAMWSLQYAKKINLFSISLNWFLKWGLTRNNDVRMGDTRKVPEDFHSIFKKKKKKRKNHQLYCINSCR